MAETYKEYLGDAVYAAWEEDRLSIVLTTEDGLRATNTIVLEPEVSDALNQWIKRVMEQRTQARRETRG